MRTRWLESRRGWTAWHRDYRPHRQRTIGACPGHRRPQRRTWSSARSRPRDC